MKTKPIIISTIACIVLIAGIYFVVRGKKSNGPVTTEVSLFLTAFNNHIVKGDTDSLLTYFQEDKQGPGLAKFIALLTGKAGTDQKEKPLTVITLYPDNSVISFTGPDLITVTIPATFGYKSLESKKSTLILKIQRNSAGQLKIIQADARSFINDFIAYENFVKSKTISDKDIYAPITLKAFITANSLKTKYDSVIWFAHIKQQTYFYVIKGKWDFYLSLFTDTTKNYKMGLVGPDLKEIIPPEYDLIHNVGGTFDKLVEVEKDHKRGFYDLNGKIIVPVIYDQVFPVNDGANIAVLKNGQDYYWLANNFTVSEKVDLKIADVLSKLKKTGSFTIDNFGTPDNVTEFNSKQEHGSIYLPPSYLVDLNLLPVVKCFKNPIRNKVDYEDVSVNYIVKAQNGSEESGSWFQSAFYKIRDYFLGGRSEFYDKKNLIIVDNKNNRLLATDIMVSFTDGEGSESLEGVCDVNAVKAIGDTLFEVKAGASLYNMLYDSTKIIEGGTYYHYLTIRNNKLIELPNKRLFGFTKYVKMDDSYLDGCYNLAQNVAFNKAGDKKVINHITPDMLKLMKNEIYADYRYHFKDKRWREVFAYITGDYDSKGFVNDKPANANVDDSLTLIDKYNIAFIDQKLKGAKTVTLAAK